MIEREKRENEREACSLPPLKVRRVGIQLEGVFLKVATELQV